MSRTKVEETNVPPVPHMLLGDIVEHPVNKPPLAPQFPIRPATKGFPEHCKLKARSPANKTFKAGLLNILEISKDKERRDIDAENRQRLADMTLDEIEEERREIFSTLSPCMIQKLLRRSHIADDGQESIHQRGEHNLGESNQVKNQNIEVPEVPSTDTKASNAGRISKSVECDRVDFPRNCHTQIPTLDLSSDSFFRDLHEQYFPLLPAEPDKLEWMQITSTGPDAYDPSAECLRAQDIRFGFDGGIIGPRTAAVIPVTEGLHHHGDSPNSAGYTIAELALLSRSAYAPQRCLAFRTLGRLLYRLGSGKFGHADDDLAKGLWREIDRHCVLDTITCASNGRDVDGGKHVSAKAYAAEAVFLWRKGGSMRAKRAE
ncbi:hypothetical protein K470DRAFT_260445 [Piedraia hortae CBS 480.64]|uniref:RNA polymerase II-associated protein 1 C-terminal domain-containing protein n=1 Tax=Piedraia hortae CBS 480.64 TaxID=1314780 RepID=A0A6A7BTH0_9PEZI|nr:hypothetical protein K470DRAFT_260445 [Piedraia hortae CBS 480.64]